MKIPRSVWIFIVPGIFLAVVFFLKQPPDPAFIPEPAAPEYRRVPTPRPPHSAGRPVDLPPGFTAAPDPATSALIRSTREKFLENPTPEEAANLLRLLREAIRQAPEEQAAAALIAFLKSGEDAPTGLPFVVGPDGMMADVPTLRLALLDLLPSLDPLSALELAREIMARRTTPDEYAISLRNLAWNDLDGDLRPELSARFLDLLRTPWLEKPTAGVLESFDIGVEIGGGPMFGEMVQQARQATENANSAVGRAAFISLDRMIVRDPALLETAFSQDPAWLDFAPRQRASLLSRLDLADPEQRSLFVRYLTATPHAAGELDYFSKLFPNANYLHGHRLVTADEATPSIAEITAADASVLRELDSLEPTLSGEAATAIQTIRNRLKKSLPAETSTPDR